MAVPIKPTVTAVHGNAKVTLSWGADATATYFLVYQNASLTPLAMHAIGTGTEITSLTNGTSYAFEVSGYNGDGEGAKSDSISATPSTTPGVPTGLTLAPGNQRITLSWTAPASNGGNAIDYYHVYKGGVELPLHALTTGTIVTGLTNHTSYTFGVIAHNINGDGTMSATATDMPYDDAAITFAEPVNGMAYNIDAVNVFIFDISTGTYVAGGIELMLPTGFKAFGGLAILSGTPVATASNVSVEVSDGVATLKMYNTSLAEAVGRPVIVNALVYAKKG